MKNIQNTISYLKSKDAPLISYPLVENSMGEEARLKTLEFLREEETSIKKRCEKVQLELKDLDDKLAEL